MYELDLSGVWQFKRTDECEWIDAKVPGSVYNDLICAGRLSDPYYRDNEEDVRDVCLYDYEYTRNFTVEEKVLAYERLILHCNGIDTLSEIIINNQIVAKTDDMHRTYEFDIKKLLKTGENNIRIILYSPLAYIKPLQEKFPLRFNPSFSVPGYSHLRKAHYVFGWDWSPQMPDLGIWRDLSIKGFNTARLDDVYVTQKHDKGKVDLDIRVRLDNWSWKPLNLFVRIIAPDGSVIEKKTVTSNCESHLEFHMDNPQIWWPNGYGDHPLYGVEVDLLDGSDMLDQKKFNIGLRTIRIRREKDQWGESFEFVVNGTSIFSMGAGISPEDNILARRTCERTEKMVKDCATANFNMIRVWGGSYYPEDCFYDACDRNGIIVYQDLMFACTSYHLTDHFIENIKKETEDIMKRLRNHACLGLWCGNNEIEEAWAVEWGSYIDGVEDWPPEVLAKVRSDYLYQFEDILPKVAHEIDPNTFYWPSTPSTGGGFNNPNSENAGDKHYWDVWHKGRPFSEFRDHFFRFTCEFGFQSFPCLKTVKTFTLPEDRNIYSYVMERHQKDGFANCKIMYYMSAYFRNPKDLDSLLYASQLLQAEAMKYGAEHWRRNRGRCMGTIYWGVNDCWPVASWAGIDYYGRWKALHYFAKRFYSPVMISAVIEEYRVIPAFKVQRETKVLHYKLTNDKGTKVWLHVANETFNIFKGEIRWKLRDNSSAVIKEGRVPVEIEALASVKCCDLDFGDELKDKKLMRKTYVEYALYKDDRIISEGTDLFAEAKHFEFMDPKISLKVKEEGDMFFIDASAKAYAKYVELDLTEADCIFSDNYFDLSAGNTKRIEVEKNSISLPLTLVQFKNMLKARSIYDIS